MMRPQTLLALWIIAPLATLAGSAAGEPTLGTAGMGDELFRVREGRGARVSSCDPDWKNGNGDARRIKPGETLTIADIEGPGIIRHIWFTISAKDPRYGVMAQALTVAWAINTVLIAFFLGLQVVRALVGG